MTQTEEKSLLVQVELAKDIATHTDRLLSYISIELQGAYYHCKGKPVSEIAPDRLENLLNIVSKIASSDYRVSELAEREIQDIKNKKTILYKL